MSYLNKKFNEHEMMAVLGELLTAGERIETAVYCLFKATGFFASNRNIITGYAALTDKDRLICCKFGLVSTETPVYNMEDITQIKISTNLFGQKIISIYFDNGKKHTVKLQIAPKVAGAGLPNQEKNLEEMLEILEAKQNKL